MPNQQTPDKHKIRAANPNDLPAIEKLLLASDLPTSGIAQHLPSFLVAEQDTLIGVIGCELSGKDALLRSLAVSTNYRKQSLGSQLVTLALAQARQNGITTAYLLTNTAADFVRRWGFAPIDRQDIPAKLLASSALANQCPASSLCFKADLKNNQLEEQP